MFLNAVTLFVLVAAPPAPSPPPAIDVAVRQLCEAGLANGLCGVWQACGPVRKGACSSTDHDGKGPTDDWRERRCAVDVRNGYLTCTENTHVMDGPGQGDVLTARWDAALFVGKGAVVVGVAERTDRPEAAFFTPQGKTWKPATPLPKLDARTFALTEPKRPAVLVNGQNGFHAEFFVELDLPREGTTVSAEGRWVDTFRDDSGYGQSDTRLTSATLELTWNAATATFVVQRPH